jgi:anti-anti-sigma factor
VRAMPERCIELYGEYDISRKDELSSIFASLKGDDPIVIDMTKVSYVDSTILHELAQLRHRQRDCSITLLGVSSNVKRIFEIVNFDRLFQIS